MPALFRRTTVWLPRPWFALAVLAVLVVVGVVAGRSLGDWLAVSEPSARRGAVLVVEGWLSRSALDRAAELARERADVLVVASGGPIEDDWSDGRFATYAERAADHLRRRGVDAARLVAAPAPMTAQDRTWHAALAVREAIAAGAARPVAIDVFSAGVHARRSRHVYRLAFGPEVEVGVIAARGERDDLERWWTTSASAKAVIGEALALAWTYCCFRPPQANPASPSPTPSAAAAAVRPAAAASAAR